MTRRARSVITGIGVRVVRWVGEAQSRHRSLRLAVHLAMPLLTRGDRTIRAGVGKGLRFNATGGFPGFALGTSEPAEQATLSRLVSAGDTVYEIGANIGFFAVLAGRLTGPSGRVWAFEPFPKSAARLRRNAELNGFAHVIVVEAAVGERSGEAQLQLVNGGSALHRVSAAPVGKSMTVNQVSIDQWRTAEGASPPDLVMIDVEGAELDVLRGMRDTLRDSTPVIMCEVHWQGRDFVDYCERELMPLGYSLSGLSGPVRADIVRWHALLTPRRIADASG